MADIKIGLKLSHPSTLKVVTVKSTDTVASIITRLCDQFGVEEKEVGRGYTAIIVPFEADIIEYANKTSNTLAELGVTSGTTFLLVPPASQRPQINVVPVNLKQGEDGSKKKLRADPKRYAGLTKAKIIEQWTEAKAKASKSIALEYIEMHGAHAISSPQFLKLSKADANTILSSDRLRATEAEVFAGALAWGKANNDEKALLNRARICLLTSKQVAASIAPTKVLDAHSIIALYSFITARDQALEEEKTPPTLASMAPALASYDANPRNPRSPPHWFVWDEESRNSQGMIKEDGLVYESTTTNSYKTAAGDILMSAGNWEWQIEVVSMMTHQYGIIIGVVEESFNNFEMSGLLGFAGQVTGWGLSVYDGNKFNNGSKGTCRIKATAGQTITVRYLSGAKELRMGTDSSNMTTIFTGVDGPVRPCVSLYGQSSVRLKFKDDPEI